MNSALAVAGTACGQKLLTPWGLAHGWLLGALLWGSLGVAGWATTVGYFAGGVAVTKLGRRKKEALEYRKGDLKEPAHLPKCATLTPELKQACMAAVGQLREQQHRCDGGHHHCHLPPILARL